uniref:RNA helicase n=3 Tax=Hirondellea gigas TaxID=1518452 RepID=A0A2P2HYL0_9CRUS
MKDTKILEKFKKRRNFKARHNVPTRVDTSEQQKIKVDLDTSLSAQCDASNALVLPSEKRQTQKIRSSEPVRFLSKKYRKRLQKIVDTKLKKANREEILSELEQMHNATKKKFPALTSLQATQTLGRKKFLNEDFDKEIAAALLAEGKGLLHSNKNLGNCSISSSAKRKRKQDLIELEANKKRVVRDPRVVYSTPSSSESSDDDEDEVAEIKTESETRCDSKTEVGELKTEENSVVTVNENEKENTEKSATTCINTVDGKKSAGPQINASVTIKESDRLPSKYVHVKRDRQMAEARLELPILAEEQAVMETINYNMVTVLVGPTGSGKTTQVPQFLYEAGFTSKGQMIGVTEPRRVAATAMAARVGQELGLSTREVSYQIRFEGNTTPDTKIKFMTDGVLLKEFQTDQLLMKYSAIIIDEAHERSVYSDLLIGILSRVVPARQKKNCPLKLIIMSATLRVEDFTENPWLYKKFGGPPPVAKVEGRMFDVTVHYNKKTADDYVEAAYNKVCKIHRQLPEGAILVFLTGQQEVNLVCKQLRATFPRHASSGTDGSETDKAAPTLPAYRQHVNKLRQRRKEHKEQSRKQDTEETEPEANKLTRKLLELKVDQFALAASVFPDNEGEMNDIDEQEEDDQETNDDSDEEHEQHGGQASDDDYDLEDDDATAAAAAVARKAAAAATATTKEQPLYVLPLYSMLPSDRQKMVFSPPPEGTRLCVVATNVAETSLTIPDVKYVIDCGKAKEKVFDKVTGVSMFHVTRCSQASANQRAGRAGRVAPGHCYRLYSSAVFNEYQKFAKPEIMCRPIDDVVLILKNLRLPVVNFPYPTPPEHVQIRQSLKRLTYLGALKEKDPDTGVTKEAKSQEQSEKPIEKDTTLITPLGRLMSSFPVAPRYAKMLCLSDQFNLWPYTIALVAALTVPEILVEMPLDTDGHDFDARRSEWRKVRLAWSGDGQQRLLGDLMVLLRAVLEAEANNNSQHFCDRYGLRQKGLLNIRKLRRQLTNEVNMVVPGVSVLMDPSLKMPSRDQCCALRQVVLSGSVDRVARRVDTSHFKEPEDKIKWKHSYRTIELEEPVFLPNSSVLKIDKPEWVAYQDIFETHKMFMRGVIAVEPHWLSKFAPLLCNFAPPLDKPAPFYDSEKDSVMCYRNATFARADWEVPRCLVPHPAGQDLYARFAYHLLKGEVCPDLLPLVDYLIDTLTLLRPLALRYQNQKDAMLRALKVCDVTSRSKLIKVWKKRPNYLLREYCMWLSDGSHEAVVKKIWPPIPKEKNEWLA